MMAVRITQAVARRVAATLRQPSRKCSWLSVAGEKNLTDFEKRIMVWGGAFRNHAEVPTKVPHAMFVKCQEKFRIKMNIYTMAACLLACSGVMYAGQQDVDAGASLYTQALERHAQALSSSE